MNFFSLFIVLFLVGMSFGSCIPNQVEFYVPAVVKPEQSQIVKIKLSLLEGEGKIYTSIEPVVGLSTQQSIKKAVKYAFFISSKNSNDCDVVIDFVGLENSSLVDGPSASLAIALATVAGLENHSYPQNAIITGEIFENGVVGPVGGILDKLQAAFKNNRSLFITPRLQFYEKLLISNFFGNLSNISIIEVDNFSEAYGALFLNQTINKSDSIAKILLPPQNLETKKTTEKEKLFLDLANKMNHQLEQISFSNTGNKNLEKYLNYFKNKTQINKLLIAKGYYYTAANNAFLDLMDAKLLEQLSSSPNIEQEFELLKNCLDSASQDNTEIYEENFELLAGAQARYMWAKNKLMQLKNITPSSLEEKYLILREVYSAQSWCSSSLYLLEKAKYTSKQTKLNLNYLNNYIQSAIENLDLIVQNSSSYSLSEARSHLLYAKNLIEEKKVAGAFFDTAYAAALIKFEADKLNLEEKDVIENINKLASKNFSTLWANLYQGQGKYLLQSSSNSTQQYLTIYSVLLLADSEEQFLSKASEFKIQTYNQKESQPLNNITVINKNNVLSENDFFVSLILVFCLFLLVGEFLGKSDQQYKMNK
ncbi:MAG: S16 family serine protease [Candidatus Anstonellaceae archaeon]